MNFYLDEIIARGSPQLTRKAKEIYFRRCVIKDHQVGQHNCRAQLPKDFSLLSLCREHMKVLRTKEPFSVFILTRDEMIAQQSIRFCGRNNLSEQESVAKQRQELMALILSVFIL